MSLNRVAGKVAAVSMGWLSFGCIATSEYMTEPKLPVPTVAPPNASVVVFVRPSAYGSSVATTILDDHGSFIGDSISGTQFATVVAPGPHLFLAWAENTAPLQAALLPGRVYYVEVSPRLGFWSPRVHLLAITPRSDSWRELGDWLSRSTQLIPDTRAGQVYLDGRRSEVVERIRRARQRLSELDADELAERTLQPQDGVVSTPVAEPAGEPAAPPAPAQLSATPVSLPPPPPPPQ